MGERSSAWRFGLVPGLVAVGLVGCGPARYHAPRLALAGGPTVDAAALIAAAHRELESGLKSAESQHRYASLLRDACEMGDSAPACVELASFDPVQGRIYLSHGCSLQSFDACGKLETFEVEHERKSRSEAARDVLRDVQRGCAQRIVGGQEAKDVCANVEAENLDLVLQQGEFARTSLGSCLGSCSRELEQCQACDEDAEDCHVAGCLATMDLCKTGCVSALEHTAPRDPPTPVATTPQVRRAATPRSTARRPSPVRLPGDAAEPLASIRQADLFASSRESERARAAVLRQWLDAREWGL